MSHIIGLFMPPRSPQIGAGHELAMQMLDELGEVDTADRALLDPEYRHHQPYRDIVGDYLARAREASQDVERGFTMILSDLVATVVQGAVPDLEYYDGLVERGVLPGAQPVMRP